VTHRVINMWNSFTDLEKSNFGSLNAFNKSLERANLNQFLTVYRFPVVCIVHSCCICVLTVGVNLSLLHQENHCVTC